MWQSGAPFLTVLDTDLLAVKATFSVLYKPSSLSSFTSVFPVSAIFQAVIRPSSGSILK
jgi:hypothetical protein